MEDDLDLSDGDSGLEDYPTLMSLGRFVQMVRNVYWFSSVGEPITPAEQADAESYVAALGFPMVSVAPVTDWADAEMAARNPDWNTEWWEAEEQLRAGLTAEAAALVGDEETLLVALTNVTSVVSDAVHGAASIAASRSGIADAGLIRAAAGSATQACYQAALVLAADGDEDHPFSLKFRLFEAGRWPLGIVGSSFNLF